jgi:chromosome segregation ATPase
MTTEEITQTLQAIAANQAKHDEMHARHSMDIAEIDRMIAATAESQNRYDKQLGRLFDVVSDLSDKQLKNEELFAELAAARERHEVRMGQLEASYELFESFVKDFREETHEHFAETDKRLADLAGAQAKTDEQIKALILAQTRTDEMVRALIERNGSGKKKNGSKKPRAKKGTK